MKRAITGIVAASLTLGTMAPAAFAATASTTQYFSGHVTLGSYSAGVSGVVANDAGHQTGFFPFYYVNQALSAAGYTVAWDGAAGKLSITTPSGVTPDLTNLNPGSGKAGIYINGTLVQNAPFVVAKDNGGKGVETSFMPIYYINKALARVGFTNSYNAGNWTLTQSKLSIVSATQTGAQKVTVKFNKAVPSGTTINLTSGAVTYTTTTTWDSTNSVATVDTGFALPAGTYTVDAGNGVTSQVTLAAAAAKNLVVTSTSLQNIAAAPFGFELDNQFGEKMTTTASQFTVNAYDTTAGVTVPAAIASGAWQLDLSNANIKKGDQVVVTVVDNASAVSVTKTLSVVGASNVSTVTLSGTTPATGKDRVYATNTGVTLNYSMKDQYGTALTLPLHAATPGNSTPAFDGVQFISSDTTVVDPATFAVDANGNLTFTAGNAGTAAITAVVQATGATSTLQVTVSNTSAVKNFTVSAPTSLVTAGAKVQLPYSAVDQFGAAITQANFTNDAAHQQAVSFTSSNTGVVNPSTDIKFNAATNELDLTPTAAGSATVYVYVGGVLQNSLPLTVNAAAVPTKIVGITDVPTEFLNGATATIGSANLKVVDQYNRPFTLTNQQVDIALVNPAANNVGLGGANWTTGTVTLSGSANVGNEQVTVALHSLGAASAYTFSLGSEAATSVTSYSLASVPTLYANSFTTKASAAGYAQALSLTGKDASGNVVALPSNEITNITSSNPSVVGTDNTSGAYVFALGSTAGSSTVAVWNGATQLASTTVNTSTATPVPTTVQFVSGGNAVTTASFDHTTATATSISSLLQVQDQYGATIVSPGGYWISSAPSVVTLDSSTGAASGWAVGTATITYVSSTGKTITLSITVS